MPRRTDDAAAAAAAQASEAARVLQARRQEKAPEPPPSVEPAPEVEKSEVIPAKQIKRGNTVREAMMEEIRSSRGQVEPPSEPPKEEPKAEAPPEEPKVEAAPEQQQPEPEPTTVKVKVDGEEFDAPKAEVDEAGGVKAYQILKASENRLKKANEALAEVRRLQAEAAKPVTPPAPKETDEQFIASKMDEIRFGTPEQGAAAMRAILDRQQKVDPNQIVNNALAEFNHQAAVREFDKEFADLVANPVILGAVVALRERKLNSLKQSNPNTPIDWNNFYRTIGTEVRSAFGRQSQPAAPPKTSGTPSPSSEKEARKSSITNLPQAAARAELPAEEKPETREESLNRMRKARGLPIH